MSDGLPNGAVAGLQGQATPDGQVELHHMYGIASEVFQGQVKGTEQRFFLSGGVTMTHFQKKT